jgi:signal transduction histidine kinase/DNA-binding response OmpR family regulator
VACGYRYAAAALLPTINCILSNPAWNMKSDKYAIAAAAITLAAVCLIVLTWLDTTRFISEQRQENIARVEATLSNQALTFSEQFSRQILALDQTLQSFVDQWQKNPHGFDLESSRAQATILDGLSRDMVLTDEHGIIRQSSVNEAIDQNASNLDYFRALANPVDHDTTSDSATRDNAAGDPMYIGPATIDGIMRLWHMNVARALHHADGSFAGVIDADYRISAITDVFKQTDLGIDSLQALVGLDDGKLRGVIGPATVGPNIGIGETPMFAAVNTADHGTWIGPSAVDAVSRIHAFRRIPGRNLTVIVAMDEDEAMRPVTVWQRQAYFLAGCMTVLLLSLALALIQGTRLARRRQVRLANDRAALAASNAQFEVARALVAAKAEQLEATLAGMNDGVAMIDAHMCLVEWNARFPEIAGVPAERLRVGLPAEEILRAQIKSGQFGPIQEPDAEVDNRIVRLKRDRFELVQRERPDGRTVELRRNRLPDGGFVAIYTDVTDQKRAEEALHQAQTAAETATAEKSRFVAIVSHEIRTPLNALLSTIQLLSDSDLAPAQQSLLAMASQSAEVLFGLVNDILDISQMEAGKLSIRSSLFALRPLLDSCKEVFAGHAAERGMILHADVAHGTPEMLIADPNRLRQIILNLLSNVVKYARPGTLRLTAEPGGTPDTAVRLTVRDEGPVIALQVRQQLFRPFSRLDRQAGQEAAGTGLGLSICHHLMTLMNGEIGYEPWRMDNGQEGNNFWITLPATALAEPSQSDQTDRGFATGPTQIASNGRLVSAPGAAPSAILEPPRRPSPRTRVLVTEDVPVNRRLTAALLRREGHYVDVADSGQAAIEALERHPYDLVFMDISMPGMSGQDATRIIRSLPEPVRSVPIVALTGHVGTDDAAAFMADGLDDVLEKPASLPDLLRVLQTHVWAGDPHHGRSKATADVPDFAQPAATMAVLDQDRINELATNLPPELFLSLIEACLLDLDNQLPALRRALTVGAPASVSVHAHAMVGTAAGHGMSALERRLRTIMDAAHRGDLLSLSPSIVAELETDFNEAVQALRDMLGRQVIR